jgi:nitroreductase
VSDADADAAATDELYATIRCAPTTRAFRPTPVPAATIHRVLDNARFAPSGGNRQGWRLVIVDEPELRVALRDLYLTGWRPYLEETGAAQALRAADAGELDERQIRGLRAANNYALHLDEVPLHIVVCVELAALALADRDLPRPSIVGGASIYPFVQNVLLGLRHEGLGAAFTTFLAPAEEKVRELLEIPDGIAVAGHIGVGERADPWPTRLSRNPVESFAFSNRWGEALRP